MDLPKRIIVDASIMFSFFKKNSVRRRVFEELLNNNCKLISPDFVLEELRSLKEKIIEFSNISVGEFEFTFSVLEKNIKIIPEKEYKEFLDKSRNLSPHSKSTKDDPYFALSLATNSPIWSDEKEFKQQSEVEVLTTGQLAKETL